MATVALGVVGGALLPGVGTFIGAAVGSLIDQYIIFPLLFPPEDIKGPRLGETRVQGADEGFPQNLCLGEATRCAGEIIWMSNLIEVKDEDEEGSFLNKQKITKYRYFVHLDICVCANEVENIDKIWANGKLIYERVPLQEEIEVEDDGLAATVEVETRFITSTSSESDDGTRDAEVVGTVFPGNATVTIDNLDGGYPSINETFTVQGDSNTYAVTSITPIDDTSLVFTFAPPAVTQWDDNDDIDFTNQIQVRRLMVITSTDPAFDLSVFQPGTVEVSGYARSQNNGSFVVLSATIASGTSVLKVLNPNAVAESAGEVVNILQKPDELAPKIVTSITIYNGTQSQLPDPLVESFEGAGKVPSYRGQCHVVFNMFRLEEFGNAVPNFEFLVRERTGRTVGQTIETICERAGFSKAEVDVSTLQDEVMLGYTIKGTPSTLQALQQIMVWYNLISQERNGVLTFIRRNAAPQIPIASTEFSAYTSDDARQESIQVTDERDGELPSLFIVKYSDPARDYLAGTQSARKNFHSVETPAVLEFALTGVGSQARAVAERSLWYLHANRQNVQLALPPSRATLREYDTLNLEAHGKAWDPIVEKIDRGQNWLVQVEAMQEELSVATQAAIADAQLAFPGRDSTGTIDPDFNNVTPSAATPDLQIIDTAPLAAGDETQLGFYVSGALFDPTASWGGAIVYESPDDGVTYAPVLELFTEAVQGRALTVLGSSGIDQYHWDRKSSVQVELTEGSLSSKTEAEVMARKNWAMIGAEVVGFATATFISGKKWTLTTLIRGLRNTEAEISRHALNERFVLLDNQTGIEFYPMTAAQVGNVNVYKAIPDGGLLGTNYPEIDHVLAGNTMRCFSPTWARGTRDTSNNLTIRWVYRSRALTRLFGPSAAPQLEPTEKYEIDVFNVSETAVLRTITAENTTTASYSAADQTTDGLTPGNTVHLRIYQISSTIGRGRSFKVNV